MSTRRSVVQISNFAIAMATAMLVTAGAGAQSAAKIVPAQGAAIRSAVSAQTTATTLTVVSETTDKGSEVTLFAKVSGSSEAAPRGTVTFLAGGKAVGEGTLVRGAAHLTISTLPAGTTTLTARYAGTQELLPSKSSPVNVYVDPEVATASASAPTETATVEDGVAGHQ